MKDGYSAEELREIGKINFFQNGGDNEKRRQGILMLLEAQSMDDPEATYYIARFLMDGVITTTAGDPAEKALKLMCDAANSGCIQARTYLNGFCEYRYEKKFGGMENAGEHSGELVDFDGKPIRINRKGVFTPVDAVLEYKDGKNILTLSTNVQFLGDDELPAPEAFREAVFSGILAWQGEYEVFGGQKLFVKVNLTAEDRVFDNLIIMPMDDVLKNTMQSVSGVIGSKEHRERVAGIIESKRSFATAGLKWSVNSRKIICIQSEDGSFSDFDEIMHVVKHEFGHSLGLGDLYSCDGDLLDGVERGTYAELDSYAIGDRFYNLVMCDHHGPISNNDVEMVVLAFRDNKMQLFQPSKLKGIISPALGKGN